MKTYSTAANAKRALKSALKKIDLELEDVAYTPVMIGDAFCNSVTFDGQEIPDGVDTLRAVAKVIIVSGKVHYNPTYIHEVSAFGGATKYVWHIADLAYAKFGSDISRSKVIETCRDAGIAYGTARTQYQKWKKDRGL